MGIHNVSKGILSDIGRTFKEKWGLDTSSVKVHRSFMTWVVDTVEANAPEASVIYLAHSEGGAICVQGYLGMKETYQQKIQKYVYWEGIAPATCIPREYGKDATNTYSKSDFITGWFAAESNEQYDVQWVEALTPLSERTLYFADHPRAGSTYKGVGRGIVDKYNERCGFYVGNQR
jgi:hypothetical protein